MRMKGLNNDDVMQSALCTFIYASVSSPAYTAGLGIAMALLDRQLKVALKCQEFCINVSAPQHLLSLQTLLSLLLSQAEVILFDAIHCSGFIIGIFILDFEKLFEKNTISNGDIFVHHVWDLIRFFPF